MKGENVAVLVSKADALIEMVKAYDNNHIKKGKKIGEILTKSIQEDNKTHGYSKYIKLGQKSKQFFPPKIRKNTKQTRTSCSETPIQIKINDEVYEIDIAKDVKILKQR